MTSCTALWVCQSWFSRVTRSFAANITDVTLWVFSEATGQSIIFFLCLPVPCIPSSLPVEIRCSKPALLIMYSMEVACHFLILLPSLNPAAPTSLILLCFAFPAVYGIFGILLQKKYLDYFCFLCNNSELLYKKRKRSVLSWKIKMHQTGEVERDGGREGC